MLHVTSGNTPTDFQRKNRFTTRYITRLLGFSPQQKQNEFPHLIVRHDIERVPVHREGHVSEDGPAILHHSHCLI